MRVRIPASLRANAGPGTVDLAVPAGRTLRRVLDEIDRLVPGALAKLLDQDGSLRRYVNIYVNGDDIRSARRLDTVVHDSDEIVIQLAISGG